MAAADRKQRLPEQVAQALRERILAGELGDGDMLPKQDELLAEFGVSIPCIREALRILETEGLVTVVRGNVGGAVVHTPSVGTASYMLGLVLQAENTDLGDLVEALGWLQPVCAVACAQREDRSEVVLPKLRSILDRADEAVDDAPAFVRLSREFHTAMAALCGNRTMALISGALERLWTAQVERRSRGGADFGQFNDRSARLVQALGHERIYRKIAEGDVEGVRAAFAQHLEPSQGQRNYAFDNRQLITVSDGRA